MWSVFFSSAFVSLFDGVRFLTKENDATGVSYEAWNCFRGCDFFLVALAALQVSGTLEVWILSRSCSSLYN